VEHFEGRMPLARDSGVAVLQQEWMERPKANHGLVSDSLLVMASVF
jgi:hypothetical protein